MEASESHPILGVSNLIQTWPKLCIQLLRFSISFAEPVGSAERAWRLHNAMQDKTVVGRNTIMAIALLNGMLYAGIAIVVFVGAMVMVMGLAAKK